MIPSGIKTVMMATVRLHSIIIVVACVTFFGISIQKPQEPETPLSTHSRKERPASTKIYLHTFQ